jgi:gliding motility-associated-like protein
VGKSTFILLLSLFTLSSGWGQNPSTCFEIESILVDACGNPEGENEMVRFHVGPNPLNTAALNVNWPNNGWLGTCQSVGTATKVAQLNASITACGFLLEPPAGIIPAGATVILVTSTNFNTSANSFAGLSDTLYIIFQCQGNTTGHFANATGSGLRTLTMTFGAGCSDAVTYDCQQLVDINGNTGVGGSSSDRDGSNTNFAWNGTATYVNYGCTAPFIPQIVDAGPDLSACQGDTISLNGFVSNTLGSIQWTGGTGTWINPTQANAQYVVGLSDIGNIHLELSAANCNGTIIDTMHVLVYNLPVINLTPSGIISICTGDTVTLDAGPGGPYTWSTGVIGPSIDVFTAGTYMVSATSSCGTLTDTATVISGSVPVASINPSANLTICPGDSLQLYASGGVNYIWTTGSASSSVTIYNPSVYGVVVSNSCGSDTASVQVLGNPAPAVNITNGSIVDICQGNVVNLEATGVGNIDWPGISTDSIIPVTISGIYLATATNSCGVDSALVAVNVNQVPSIQTASSFAICQGASVTVNPVYVGNISWSDGTSAASQTFNTGGNYYVAAYNGCGADTAFFTIVTSFVTADFSADSIYGSAPLEVHFVDASTNANSYHWDFGTGDTSDQADPVYTFLHPGGYLVVLTVYNTDGCMDTASQLINVKMCDNKVFIPNTFTPNLDETNQQFHVISNCVQQARVTIFDRWGKELYSWTDMSEGWNGKTASGEELPIGVYVYFFELDDVNGDNYTYRGMVHLLR